MEGVEQSRRSRRRPDRNTKRLEINIGSGVQNESEGDDEERDDVTSVDMKM
jgi:hypothetical protein